MFKAELLKSSFKGRSERDRQLIINKDFNLKPLFHSNIMQQNM